MVYKRRQSIDIYLRYSPQMKKWRTKYTLKYNNKCAISGKHRKGCMHIHHIIPHHTIRNEVLYDLNLPLHRYVDEYTEEELKAISSRYIDKHSGFEGILMLKRVHKLFHKIYGNNTTMENYLEFKERWDNGEFKK